MELLQEVVPLYHQLKTYIKQQIESGQWQPGIAIPSERELEKLLGLSRTPIRQALGELVAEGWLERKHGKGTFVAQRTSAAVTTKLVGLVEQLRSQGLYPTIEIAEFGHCEAPAAVSQALGIPASTQMIRTVRRIAVSSGHVIVDENYFNINLSGVITEERLGRSTVFDLLEQSGVNVKKGSQSYSAVNADARIARLLEVPEGTALLVIQTLLFNNRDQPLQYSLSYCNPERYNHEILLSR